MRIRALILLLIIFSAVQSQTTTIQQPCPTSGGQTTLIDAPLVGGIGSGQTTRIGVRDCNTYDYRILPSVATFIWDDVTAETYTKLYPMMLSYNIPMVWAVNTNLGAGGFQNWYNLYYKNWVAAGGEIADHTPQHTDVRTVTATAWDSIVRVSKDTIVKYIGYSNWFIYAFNPYWYSGPELEKELITQKYYQNSINDNDVVNDLSERPFRGFRVQRAFNNYSNLTTLKSFVRQAYEDSLYIALWEHAVLLNATDSTNLCRIIEYIKDTLDIPIVTLTQAKVQAKYASSGTMNFTSTQGSSVSQVTFYINSFTGSKTYIDWGDGNISTLIATGRNDTVTSAYSVGNKSYNIRVYGDLWTMRKFIAQNNSTLTGSINEFAKCARLQELELINLGTWTGNYDYLPTTLAIKNLYKIGRSITNDDEIIFHSIQPTTVNNVSVILNVTAGHSVFIDFGDGAGKQLVVADGTDKTLNSAYPTLAVTKKYSIRLTGELGYLKGFTCTNETTVSYFDIDDFYYLTPTLTTLSCYNYGTYINSSMLLPSTLTTLQFRQLNNATSTFYGTINNLPANLLSLRLETLTGSIVGTLDSLPVKAYTTFILSGIGAFHGDIKSLYNRPLAATITVITTGTLTCTSGTPPAWATSTITIQGNLTTAYVDQFLNDWASPAGVGTRTIDLRGTNQARSSASDAAVITLTGKGKTILTN